MSLEDEIAMLARLPVLSELDEEALRVLAFSTDTRTLATGETLVRRGDRSEGGFFVLSGSLALYRNDLDDGSAMVISMGGLLGEMAMIAVTENQVTAIAREPTSVLRIPRALFQRVLREYPGSAARLRQSIENQLTAFMGKLDKLREKTPEN